MLSRSCGLLILLVLLCSCQKKDPPEMTAKGATKMSITVTSTAFSEGKGIPSKYTCDGENISPPLGWSGVPTNAKSIALITDDPDAPRGTFTHWVLFNLEPDTTKLPGHVPTDGVLKDGAEQGTNDAGKIGYAGPCPPSGVHRYRFKVYALDARLDLSSGVHVADLTKAMEGHVLAQGQLMGTYSRK